MANLFDKLKKGWSAFTSRDPTPENIGSSMSFYGSFGSTIPYRKTNYGYFGRNDLKSMVSFIYNRIAVDCAAIDINHVRIDENGRYVETINDSLNRALTKEANINQTGRALIEDLVYSMLDEGVIAVVPTTVDVDPNKTESYKIIELQVAKITGWRPREIEVDLYSEDTGKHIRKVLSKSFVAIIKNPFYEIMNDVNSTGQRLRKVLRQLDKANEGTDPGKLDLIIQLPYVIKTDAKRQQAEQRRKDIETQLTGSQYGIAYTDGTERIIQLNRSLENNLWVQAKELTEQFYNQMGFSKAIFDGTADEKTMLNYMNQTIEPIMSAIVSEMDRKWISKTASSQGQAIQVFQDPFKLVPTSQLAELADKFTRNEIMTSNEIRAVMGLKPVDDKKADELRNSNLNHPDETGSVDKVEEVVDVEETT